MLDPIAPQWGAMPPATALGDTAKTGSGVLEVDTTAGPLRVAAVGEGTFRWTLGGPPGPDYGILDGEPAPIACRIESSETGWLLRTREARLHIQAEPLHISLFRGTELVLESATDSHFVRKQRLPPFAAMEEGHFAALALESGDAVYGLGEKWGPLNRRGQLVTSWDEDALGVNAERSYKNCPFAWSPRGWGLFVHTPARVRHGIGYAQFSHRSYTLEVSDSQLDLFLIAGEDGRQILERYTDLTGRTPMPPLWGLGVWMSRAYYADADELLETAHTLRDRGIPSDVIVLDGRAWQDTDTRFTFAWDTARYHEPAAITAALHDLDYKVCVWEYPLVSKHGPLHAEMAEKGWLLANGHGAPYEYTFDPEPFGEVLTQLPDSGLVDFTHPEAYAFWRDSHARLFRDGVDVIKPDFGEQVEPDTTAHNGDSGERLHNAYPLLYNRCVFEATAAHSTGSLPMVLSRAGWAGSQRYPVQWGGDPQSDWEGLAASIRGGLSWGLSGVPCYATDIGGFYGAEMADPELFVRWAQAAVFCSHMRFHGIGKREPWHYGAENEAIVRRFIQLRYRLIPYLDGVLQIAHETGLPVMRPMVLDSPEFEESWSFEQQYFFGPEMLVVPVVRPQGKATVHLPPGTWYDFWTGQALEGGRTFHTKSPLGTIPVYVRANSIIPLGPKVQHTGEFQSRGLIERLIIYGRPIRPPCLHDVPCEMILGPNGQRRLTGFREDVQVEVHGIPEPKREGGALVFG